jgi:hypothetical protein
LKELAADIAKQGKIFDPIHTASVPGESKPFVIDGVSRLDAMESLGWEIVDAKGNWIGALATTPGSRPMVIDHPGYSHEQVWDLVVSLNLKRRHYNESQRAVIANKLAKKMAKESEATWENSQICESVPRPAHRPSKGLTEATKKAAEMMNVSPRSVDSVRKVEKHAPDKVEAIKAGKLSVSKAAREIKPKHKKEVDKTSDDFIVKRFLTFIDYWPVTQHRAVRRKLRGMLLGRRERKDGKDHIVLPEFVIWSDGKKESITRL